MSRLGHMYRKCIRFSFALLHRGHATVVHVLRNLFISSWKWYRPTMIRTTTWVRITAFRLRGVSCHIGCIRLRVPWWDGKYLISRFLMELICPVLLDSLFYEVLPLVLARWKSYRANNEIVTRRTTTRRRRLRC